MKSKITFVLTSCNRFDLLEKTIMSFLQYNTYPITHYIFIEDSPKIQKLEKVIKKFPDVYKNATLLHNATKLGQMASIDKAYSHVKTDYIFHCEEDWAFYKKGFIENSLTILQKYPNIISIWLRAMNDTNHMPIEKKLTKVSNKISFYTLSTNYKGVWHGFTLNPGLRRYSDYKLAEPFAEKGSEEALSIFYNKLGFRGVILPEGYVKHLGWHRSVLDLKEGKIRTKTQYEIDALFKKAKALFYKKIGLYGKKYK